MCKTIYVLKQAPHAWYNKLTSHFLSMGFVKLMGFVKSKSDLFLFVCPHSKVISYLFIYMEDIILTRNHTVEVKEVISFLALRYSLKDLGSVTYFLGLR